MMVSKKKILASLPPYRDQWITVKKNQDVDDIIQQILKAHKKYADFYDKFALEFDADSLEQTCDALYKFCQRNIAYQEEPGDDQTTALPTGFLTRGAGDCKHYASFCGGVLDSISRQTGKPIDWSYRFASYKANKKAHHVFIVVNDDGQEIWIDPVPGANHTTPVWILDKKVNVSPMALRDNIGFIHSNNSIGWTVETSAGYTTSGPTIVPQTGHPFYGEDFLGLSRYGNPTNTDLDKLTSQLNAIIAKGPSPYTLEKSLVEKILRDNVQNWNFYYPNGTSPNPRNWESKLGQYLNIILTPDGRLTFDRDGEPAHNIPEIHYLVDWVNYYVQQFSDEPYIVLIDHLKRLGKGWKTPESGSLWRVIHTGDVHFAKVTELVDKIPGLKTFLATFGVSLDSLKAFAQKFMGGAGGSNPATPIPQPGGQYNTDGQYIPPPRTAGQSFDSKTMAIVAAVGLGAYFILRKPKRGVSGIDNNTLLIGGSLVILYLLSRKKETPAISPDPGIVQPPITVIEEMPPSTELQTPPFVEPSPIPSPVPYQGGNQDDVIIDILYPIKPPKTQLVNPHN